MKATLSNFRQPPRKVRLLARELEGKAIAQVLTELDFLGRKAAGPIKKLIASAVANAKKNQNKDQADLYIKKIRVDKGLVMKRSMPRAQGRSTTIRHRTSHIQVELGENKSINSTDPAISKGKTVNKKTK